MEQLRIYTLTNKSTTELYFKEHWTRHIESHAKFGIQVKGVWIGQRPESENQVIANVSFPDYTNIEETTERCMKSPEFADDMEGFDINKITHVESQVMKSA